MAKNQTRRLTPAEIAKDVDIYAAVKDVRGYAPANSDYSLESLAANFTALTTAQVASAQADATAAAKRDDLVTAQWNFHNGILGAKDSVLAQFGPDANEVQAVQLKKKTEYKSRARKAQSAM